jgi:LysM repeat protein
MNCFRNTVLQVPPDKSRSRVKVVMFSVLGFHAAILLGLLIQGCRSEPTASNSDTANPSAVADNATPPLAEAPAKAAGAPAPAKATATVPANRRVPAPANPPAAPSAPTLATAAPLSPKPSRQIAMRAPSAASAPAPAKPAAPASAVASAPPSAPAPTAAALPAPKPSSQIVALVPAVSPNPNATDYTVVAGDTFGRIAKSLHATVKALANANPGVDSAKLRIGQKIHVPTASETTAQSISVQATPSQTTPVQAVAASNTASSTDEHVYTVQHGDYLFKIAKQFGLKASAIREANGLKKDQLVVGQKLKIPAKGSATAARATATTASALPAAPHAGA